MTCTYSRKSPNGLKNMTNSVLSAYNTEFGCVAEIMAYIEITVLSDGRNFGFGEL